MDAMLIFPHQLFVKNQEDTVFIFLEDWHFFNREIPFHKHKLILHRASMKAFFSSLKGDHVYLEYPFKLHDLENILKDYDHVYAYDPVDTVVKKTYNHLPITWLQSLNFLTDEETITHYFQSKKSYLMHDFYVFQRKRLNLLMEDGKPSGGRYSFDQENRKSLPKELSIPKPLVFDRNDYIIEAINWVNTHFKSNPGRAENFNYPVTHEDAQKQLAYFLTYKFDLFGPYQDALSEKDPYLFHSNLSSSLNIGLLSPNEIINAALKTNAPIESKEGFIRQIIGWREFIRALYILEGRSMKSMNFLNHKNKLSSAWYRAETKIPIIDQTIHKLITTAYSHHIERLMVLGNFMFLLNIDPFEVYKYFMVTHIDAYEWVMVPNVYGMSQYASGPLMTTKPYFSASNYLKKMGVKNGEWAHYWDALFYIFLKDNQALIEKNPRLGILIKNLNRKDDETMKQYATLKDELLERLTK